MTTQLRVATAIATALLLAACAATTPNVKLDPSASAAVTQNPACLSETGNRITGDRASCTAFGRSYSGDDINRTGNMNVGDALGLLDPAITVHH
jgi:hypothetical protein